MAFLTDLLIALIVAAVPLYVAAAIVIKRRHGGMKDAKTGKTNHGGIGVFGIVLFFVWAIVIYGSFIEPRFLNVKTQTIVLGKGGHELTVALISDTHMGQFRHGDWMRTVVERINYLQPDLVLIAGDVVSVPGGIGALRPLKDLHAKYGAYAVLGNWDYRAGAVDVRRGIESQGVEVLTNESAIIDVNGTPLQLIGLDDATYGKPDITAALITDVKGEALVPPPEGTPKIVLAHNPDAERDAETAGAALLLAGHTHGGQIRLPFIGAIVKLPTTIGQRYDKGLFEVGPTQMFITSGVGESSARARLFNLPEIALLKITF